MSALIANPPPIPTRPLRTGPNVRTPEQIATARDHANRAVERFSELEHAVAICLRHATETLGYRCTVSDAAAYDIRRSMTRFLATLHLDPPPHMPLSVITHALEWTGGDEDPANEAGNCGLETEESGQQEETPDVERADPLGIPDLIVCRSNTERDEMLAAFGLVMTGMLPNERLGRGKLLVRERDKVAGSTLLMINPGHVEIDDVRDKVVCGDIPLCLAMHAKLIINVEHGPPGDPPHLAAYRVHRAATNGGVN